MRTPLSRAQALPTATLKYKSITDSHLFGSISTMSSSVPYDPYIPNQTTGDQSNSRTAAIQAVCFFPTLFPRTLTNMCSKSTTPSAS